MSEARTRNFIYVTGTEGAYIVAYVCKTMPFAQDEIPAYTKDIERKFKNENEGLRLMDFSNISFLAERADPDKPWHAAQ